MIDFVLLSSTNHDTESMRHLAMLLTQETKKTIAVREKNNLFWSTKFIANDPAAEEKDLPEIEIGIVSEKDIKQAKIVTIESLLSQCLLNS